MSLEFWSVDGRDLEARKCVRVVTWSLETLDEFLSNVARVLGILGCGRMGWARWDTEKRVPVWERERLWRKMIHCGARVILEGPGVRGDERALGAYWVGYRAIYREQVEGLRDRYFSFQCAESRAAGLAVTRHPKGAELRPGPCLGDRPWGLWGTEPAPASTDTLAFWSVRGEPGGCTAADWDGR